MPSSVKILLPPIEVYFRSLGYINQNPSYIMKYTTHLISLFLILIINSFSNQGFSAHIVGGYLTYTCKGKASNGLNEYEITTTIFKDCVGTPQFPVGNTPFDKNIRIRIFDGVTKGFVRELVIPLSDSIALNTSANDPCALVVKDVCFSRAQYKETVFLADNSNGYDITFSRCCRTGDIKNLMNPDGVGMVFSNKIPDTDLCNNSPTFNSQLPIVVPENEAFSFDFSATDPDGDVLVYEISHPTTAGDRLDPIPTPLPPPHPVVTFNPGFSKENPFGGPQGLIVDPNTGQIDFISGDPGKYSFALTIKEFRNGELISETPREILFHVFGNPANNPPQILRLPSDDLNGDIMTFYHGQSSCFEFSFLDGNSEIVLSDQLIATGEGQIFDPDFGATLIYNPGTSNSGFICWTPPCELPSLDDNRVIIKLEETSLCNEPVYDTLYVNLEDASPISFPCVDTIGKDIITIYQNYPNPFSFSTTFDFLVKLPGNLTLDIFDIRGRKVATLLDKYYSQGNYRLEWIPTGVAAGMYFYRFQLEDHVVTKKMYYQHP